MCAFSIYLLLRVLPDVIKITLSTNGCTCWISALSFVCKDECMSSSWIALYFRLKHKQMDLMTC